MKFQEFYNDIITEARYTGDEKFDWVVSKLETWLFEKLFANPSFIKSLRILPKFKEYLKSNTNEPTETDSDMVMALDRIGDFLHMLPRKESQEAIKDILRAFPDLAMKFSRFGKPETPGKRGRPVGSKNKLRTDKAPEMDIDIQMQAPKQVEIEPEIEIPSTEEPSSEPKKRAGRPKIYDDSLSAIERSKYRKEGPAMIKSLESKVESLDNQVNQTIARIKKIMSDIDKRKKFFGIDN